MDIEVKKRLEQRVKKNPFVSFLGIEIISVEKGRVEARMPIREEVKQYCGAAHGGALAALGDTIAGIAAYSMTPIENDVLTAEMKTSFLRPAFGVELKAIGYVIKPGRNIHFAECEIYAENKLVAKFSGTFSVVGPQTGVFPKNE